MELLNLLYILFPWISSTFGKTLSFDITERRRQLLYSGQVTERGSDGLGLHPSFAV